MCQPDRRRATVPRALLGAARGTFDYLLASARRRIRFPAHLDHATEDAIDVELRELTARIVGTAPPAKRLSTERVTELEAAGDRVAMILEHAAAGLDARRFAQALEAVRAWRDIRYAYVRKASTDNH